MVSEIITFLLGCLVGWFTNHWYSVNMRRPSLRQSGSSSGLGIHSSEYHFISASIQNELRHLTLKLPDTILFGKRIRTSFGSQIVERDPARQCRARLLEESGEHICHLWWFIGKKVSGTVDIESGKSASLVLFIRRDSNSSQYFAYQPHSNSDLSPKTSDVAKFDKTMAFLVEVSYSHGSQKLNFPVKVIIGYDGRFSYQIGNSGGGF